MKTMIVGIGLVLAMGCSASRGRGGMMMGMPDGGPVVVCEDPTDSDGDGIADAIDGAYDSDADGTPDNGDLDSDNDGDPDAEEAGPTPCAPRDGDGDGVFDFLDTDRDNDGLSDTEERDRGTDPDNIDSDGHGVTDLGEVHGTMTDPLDRTSTIPEDAFFVVLPYNGPHENRTLRFGTNIQVADVFFLMDTTGSMYEEVANVQTGMETIITLSFWARNWPQPGRFFRSMKNS